MSALVLSMRKIREIRKKYKPREFTYKRLGYLFDVSHATIRYIVNGKNAPSLKSEDLKKIRKLYRNQSPRIEDIAKKYRVGRYVISHALKEGSYRRRLDKEKK